MTEESTPDETTEDEVSVPKTPEQVVAEHEAQLNAALNKMDAPDTTDDVTLSLPAIGDINRRDFMKAGVAVGATSALAGCSGIMGDNGSTPTDQSGKSAQHKVPPGEHDDYYGFWSGGHSGEIRVVGIPSMRELMRIPTFQAESAKGFGHDDETKAMLEEGGDFKWGDSHHPILSETDGEYDSRWLFINDKANGRMARVDLKYFETDAITNIPNIQACHGCSLQSPNTERVYGVGEFRQPLPNDGTGDSTNPDEYSSIFTALDPETMDVNWQVRVSGNLDNSDTDKEGNWAFATGYNSEEGFEIEPMSRDDRDWLKAFDVNAIDEAVANGAGEEVNGATVIDARLGTQYAKGDGETGSNPLVYYVPVPKSPHGCDTEPTGTYVTASGKLSPTVSLIEIDQLKEVDNLADAVVGQPKVGLGPLHTTWDDRGNAYTTLFIDSQVAKWNVEDAVAAEKGSEEPIRGKIDVHYNPGHLQATAAESMAPAGEYLVSLNKLSKDRFLPVGPIHPDNDQLIYIGEDADNETGGMELVKDEPVYPEPHDGVIARAENITPNKVWEREDYEGEKEYVTTDASEINRLDDSTVEVKMAAQRSEFALRDFTVQEGDEVQLTVTNIETSPDIIHGVAIPQHDINLSIAPQDTREATFTVDEPGVYWLYCTYFCSALHLEMRSRMIVEPES
jgi:nitrous-oxide reductase